MLPIQRRYGQFLTSSPVVTIYLDVGFVPDYFYMQAEGSSAAIGEVQWMKTAGDGKCMTYAYNGPQTWLTTGIASWAPAGSAAIPSRWVPGMAYIYGQIVHPIGLTSPGVSQALIGGTPVIQNLPLFQCTVAGISGANEPTWPTVIGQTVSDGTVTWTAIDSKLWSTSGQSAAAMMLTGLFATNALGQLVTPAPSGLGITIPTNCQSAGTTYDWYAEARENT